MKEKHSASIMDKHKGARAELAASVWLMNSGYEVFRNVSPFGAVDIIARNPVTQELILVDVKTSFSHITVRSDGARVEGWSIRKPHAHGLGDIKVLYVYGDGIISWKPRNMRMISLPTREPSKNAQSGSLKIALPIGSTGFENPPALEGNFTTSFIEEILCSELSVPKAAKKFGVSAPTVRKMRRGELSG